MYSVRFSKGANLKPDEIQEIEADFQRLRYLKRDGNTYSWAEDYAQAEGTEMQRKLTLYTVVNGGMRFGATSFSYVIPPKFYLDIDQQLEQKMKEFIDINSSDHFALSLAIQNAENLPYINKTVATRLDMGKAKIQSKESIKVYAGSEQVADKVIHFDAKYRKVDKKYVFPDYARIGFDWKSEAMVKVYEDDKLGIAYYQRTGKQLDGSFDAYYGQYNIGDYFNPEKRSIKVPNQSENEFEYYLDLAEYEGQQIYLYESSDPTRASRREVTVLSSTKKENKYIIKVEDSPAQQQRKDYLENNEDKYQC